MGNTNNTVIVAALNDLVKVNRDRFAGYQKAMELTRNDDLKELFQELSLDSSKNINDLSDLVLRINGEPVDHTSMAGKFYHAWMNLKSVFTGSDDHSILADCEYGEDMAINSYEKVDNSNDFIMDPSANIILTKQLEKLRESHDRIKKLRDSIRTP